MNHFIALFSLIFLSLGTVLSANSQGFTDRLFGDNARQGIAAMVEGRVITLEDLRREIRPILPQLLMQFPQTADLDREVYRIALEIRQDLINRILVRTEFDRLGFQIPVEFVNNRLKENLIAEFNGDRQRRHDYLRENGLTLQEYREEFESKVIIEVMRGRLERSQSMISPVRIQDYYEEHKKDFISEEKVHLAIVMFAPEAEEPIEVLRDAAAQLKQQLDAGGSFEELSRTVGRDPTGGRSGTFRWYSRSDLRPEISQVVFALEPGVASEPFIDGRAAFIFYVKERTASGTKSLNEVREEIEGILTNQNTRVALMEWLEQLRSKAYIRYYDI